MAHQGNGKPVEYRVSFSGEIAEQLKALKKRADAAGLGSACLDAGLAIDESTQSEENDAVNNIALSAEKERCP
jgi:hypothetical protein